VAPETALASVRRNELRSCGILARFETLPVPGIWGIQEKDMFSSGPTLSEREFEVAELVAAGMTNREIANSLTVAHSTVDAHLRIILGKLGLRNRVQLAVWYQQQGKPNATQIDSPDR
jgi:DNA-binding NarL/FixJ family response regulator